MSRRLPLVYLRGIVPGRYMAMYPVFIVGDRPEAMAFHVAVDDPREIVLLPPEDDLTGEVRRAYVTAITRRRLHQQTFRERVVAAYRRECAICRLRHENLLDAAHIVPDSQPHGVAAVFNGVAMCKLHHAAFDADLLGIRPDRVVEVHPKVLDEEDGPMLLHGLQGFHHKPIRVPRTASQQPKTELLEERYERFQRTA